MKNRFVLLIAPLFFLQSLLVIPISTSASIKVTVHAARSHRGNIHTFKVRLANGPDEGLITCSFIPLGKDTRFLLKIKLEHYSQPHNPLLCPEDIQAPVRQRKHSIEISGSKWHQLSCADDSILYEVDIDEPSEKNRLWLHIVTTVSFGLMNENQTIISSWRVDSYNCCCLLEKQVSITPPPKKAKLDPTPERPYYTRRQSTKRPTTRPPTSETHHHMESIHRKRHPSPWPSDTDKQNRAISIIIALSTADNELTTSTAERNETENTKDTACPFKCGKFFTKKGIGLHVKTGCQNNPNSFFCKKKSESINEKLPALHNHPSPSTIQRPCTDWSIKAGHLTQELVQLFEEKSKKIADAEHTLAQEREVWKKEKKAQLDALFERTKKSCKSGRRTRKAEADQCF